MPSSRLFVLLSALWSWNLGILLALLYTATHMTCLVFILLPNYYFSYLAFFCLIPFPNPSASSSSSLAGSLLNKGAKFEIRTNKGLSGCTRTLSLSPSLPVVFKTAPSTGQLRCSTIDAISGASNAGDSVEHFMSNWLGVLHYSRRACVVQSVKRARKKKARMFRPTRYHQLLSFSFSLFPSIVIFLPTRSMRIANLRVVLPWRTSNSSAQQPDTHAPTRKHTNTHAHTQTHTP